MPITYPRTIWIVRHAEREDNINTKWRKKEGGQELAIDNSMLSDRGKHQASECHTRFKNAKIDHVFASPFDRTVETASIIVDGKGLKVKAEGGLCEALYLCESPPGFWETEKLAGKFPLVDKDYIPVFSRYTLPRESCGDKACVGRVRKTLTRLFEKYEGNLLLVGHGASIGACHEVLIGDFKYVGQATVSEFEETAPNCFRHKYSSDASHLSDKSNLRPWMNILHHKSWHVRTKANMQRVRRDEAKAAEEEQKVLDRQIQAENERRIGLLRSRAEQKMSNMFDIEAGASGTSNDVSISDETGHVNLFQDLEREERKNLGVGNKEYDEEKAKEKREWESKMGIQVYFAENTNDLDKKKEWYEKIPMRKAPDKKNCSKHEDLLADRKIDTDTYDSKKEKKKKKRKRRDSSEDSDSEVEKKKKKKKKKHKKRKHRDSSEERKIEEEYDKEKKKRLDMLRDERLKRERIESARTYSLLHPEEMKKKEIEEKSKRPKYNSQFNPEFTRR